MRITALIVGLALAFSTGIALCATAGAPKGHLLKDIELQSFFHTPDRWQVKIYEPAGQNAEFRNQPVRVCFVKEQDINDPASACAALFGGAAQPDGTGLPLQTLDSAYLQMLPAPDGGPGRPSLVVRATFAGGGPGELKGLYVWTDSAANHGGSFDQTFSSVISQAGDQQFVHKGLLAGAFVSIDQVHEGNEPDMESPVRYQMTVYEPAPLGYVKVLSMLSKKRYPSNHTRDGLSHAIDTLTPALSRALKAVYPEGVAELQR